jgi:hypothetical protein
MVDADKSQQQTSDGSVIAPVLPTISTEADLRRMSVAPSTSKNMSSDTVTQGDVSASASEDALSDTNTIVKSKPKKPPDAEIPSIDLLAKKSTNICNGCFKSGTSNLCGWS